MLHVNRWVVVVASFVLSLVVLAVVFFTSRTPASSETPILVRPLEFPYHVATVSGLDLWLVQPHGELHYQLTCERPGLATDVQVGVGATLTARERMVDIPATRCGNEASLVAQGSVPELSRLNIGEAGTISLASHPRPEVDHASKVVIGIYRGKDLRLYEGFGT